MIWLRNKLRKWLGTSRNLELIRHKEAAINKLSKRMHRCERTTKDLVNIGLDVNFAEPHTVVIFSKLNGGQLRIVPTYIDNMRDLECMVKSLERKYNTRQSTMDKPYSFGKIT